MPRADRRALPALTLALLGAWLATSVGGCASVVQVTKLLLQDDSRTLRERPEGAPGRSSLRPSILLLPIDGVDRDLLYEMLREGELPGFARLLSAEGQSFPHAHFEGSLLATMPSSTMAAWATVLTGVGPAHHGMAGNEFFVRSTRVFSAPIPGTFHDAAPTIACLTSDEYCNRILTAPTVYQQMRARDEDVLIWVAMHHIYTGADVIFAADRTAIAKAFESKLTGTIETLVTDKESRADYETLDGEVIEVVIDALEQKDIAHPDVLTVYLSGTDLYGHIAREGPDKARRAYLREVLDPHVATLDQELRSRGLLDNRWVVITSDHGHTEVMEDEEHALATDAKQDPPCVLLERGFRLREFQREVAPEADFQAVLAYQGAVAYVYTADRSTCPAEGDVCDWKKPPRFEEDVMDVARSFWQASEGGTACPAMKGTIDMVLARKPTPYAEVDLPFEVFDGKELVPVDAYLQAHPHPSYVALSERLQDLAVGPHGERAGDVILIAHNGDRDRPADRYYFATPYRSWHGSPSRKDSEVPLIVAHPKFTATAIGQRVGAVLGTTPRQQKVTDLLLSLRFDE